MFKRQVFKPLVLFLFSAIGTILTLDTSMGQVRFEDPVNLSDKPIDSWNPDIAAVDDQVFVVWRNLVLERSDLILAHSRDKGRTFRPWNLSLGLQDSANPKVVAEGNNIYIGWAGQVSLSPRITGIFLSRSNDRGESFYPPYDLSGRGSYNTPVMRLQDGILNVAWGEWDPEPPYSRDIAFAKSTDFGKSFSEPVNASNLQQWTIGAPPELALDGDQVYVAWMGGRPGWDFHDIYFVRSTDGGKSFGEATSLSKRTQKGEATVGPQLAVGSNGYVYVAWSQGLVSTPATPMDVYLRRSTDGGETFEERIKLSNDPGASNLGLRMAASGENIYVLWTDISQRGPSNIVLSRSTDGGKTFSAPENISQSSGSAANAEIAIIEKGKLLDEGITEDVIHLVWQDGRTGNPAVFFSVSLDGGATFSQPENISHNRSFASGPRIAAAGRNVYITWMDNAPRHWSPFFVRGQLELDTESP